MMLKGRKLLIIPQKPRGGINPSNPIPNPEIPQKLSLSSLAKVFQLLDHAGELRDERVVRASLRKHSNKLSVIPELLFLARAEAHPEVFFVPPVIRKD
jgi:hypothetical protein